MKYIDNISNESLETIRGNECETDITSLCTKRFRRLWNEIIELQERVAILERGSASPPGHPQGGSGGTIL